MGSIILCNNYLFANDVNDKRWKINSVKVGIEGYYKNGLWTAVVVNWTMPSVEYKNKKDISVTINSIDSDGVPIVYRKKITETERENLLLGKLHSDNSDLIDLTTTVYFKSGRSGAKISVNIELDGKIVATTTLTPKEQNTRQQQKTLPEFSYNNSPDNFTFLTPIPSERRIILIVGNEDIGLQGAIAELALREERRPLIVKINSAADLPDQWFGYEAINMIVLTTTEPDQFKKLHANSPQILAIDKWIKLGGHLFFCAGRESESLIAGESAPLSRFLSGKFEKMTDIRKGDLLETFVLSKRKIQIESANDFLIMPLISNPKGLIRLRDGDMPIVSQHLHGFGTITYFGGDLSGKPLGKWRDRTTFIRKILRWDLNQQNISQQDSSLIRPAFNDISGQIRSAADRFDEVKIMPFSLILIILVVYWLIVGLGDWFIVRRFLKRPMLTWVTFPFWILLFSVVSYVFVINGHPNRAILRELVVIDLETEQNIFRSSVWGNLYSPRDAHYSLELQDKNNLNSDKINYATSDSNNPNFVVEDETSFFSWHGLTGDGLGGMNPKTFNPTVWRSGSLQNEPEKIDNVPIQIRATKSFYGERFGVNKNIKSIKSNLFADEGLPVGELLFDGLPAMKNVILIYGRWLMPIGDTPERGKITIDKKSQRRNVGDILLSKIAMDDESLRMIASYNTRSSDATYIVKVLSVHEQLGGYETIGLFNTFQHSLDMSNILATNHAILIGEFQESQTSPDGIKISTPVVRHTKTILRQVLPVTPKESKVFLHEDSILDRPESLLEYR
ncbi:MAG: hypothetical protein LBH59_08095 [Planctomycetaceae bacterium]|nr:hypothetical protein [Planctomycetaceae bacterium]